VVGIEIAPDCLDFQFVAMNPATLPAILSSLPATPSRETRICASSKSLRKL